MDPGDMWLNRGLGNFQTHQSTAAHQFSNKDPSIYQVFGS